MSKLSQSQPKNISKVIRAPNNNSEFATIKRSTLQYIQREVRALMKKGKPTIIKRRNSKMRATVGLGTSRSEVDLLTRVFKELIQEMKIVKCEKGMSFDYMPGPNLFSKE